MKNKKINRTKLNIKREKGKKEGPKQKEIKIKRDVYLGLIP